MVNKHIALDILYYKGIYRDKILLSKPVICDKESDFEIHILTCKNDFLDSLWCLKTFCYFSGLRPKLVIHSDGTLRSNHVNIFSKHFTRCKVITRKEADLALKQHLKKYKYCSKFRFDHFLPYSIKLFDFIYYSQTGKILLLDSDILFFRKPHDLINSITKNRGVFLSDCRDSYSFSKDYLNRLFSIKVRSRVNCGLIYFPEKKYYDLDFIESCLRETYENNHPTYWVEQTAWALLVSKCKQAFTRLAPPYGISTQPLTDKTVCYHFASRSLRFDFYKEGLRRLNTTGFLEKQLRAKPE